ncbi:MAG: hypothetical protein GY820_41210 [Gammaproteobacteria bacterium]|nr:hypothetical protein [Gammaproteobacteria bacterium]
MTDTFFNKPFTQQETIPEVGIMEASGFNRYEIIGEGVEAFLNKTTCGKSNTIHVKYWSSAKLVGKYTPKSRIRSGFV